MRFIHLLKNPLLQVLFTDQGHLSAKGGTSGYRETTSQHCGDGGGGGVIQVFSIFDNNTQKSHHVNGGNGIDSGGEGVVFQGGKLMILLLPL